MPFAPNGDLTTFYGSPIYNAAKVEVQTGMAVIEHDFGNGLTVKNSSLYADYNRGYRNVYPGGTGGGPGGGAVTPDLTQVSLNAYQNYTPRENAFNQTDFVYKTATGPVLHTVAFGTEFGRQTGLSRRNSGIFPNNANKAFDVVNPFNPTYFGPVVFNHLASDANSKYRLNTASGYVQDQIELTRWLQLFVGARYDSFDMSALDLNTSITRNRVDEKISPRAAVIVKPIDNLSIYTAYSISYLPASGDQFSALSPGTLILRHRSSKTPKSASNGTSSRSSCSQRHCMSSIVPMCRSQIPIIPASSSRAAPTRSAVLKRPSPDTSFPTGRRLSATPIPTHASQAIHPRPSSPETACSSCPTTSLGLWNKYQINSRWAASLGIIYFSDSFASSDDSVRLPGFWRFDAGLFAKIDETWSAQLNVENIFNKGYWATADGNNNLSPGQGRTVRVLARARF